MKPEVEAWLGLAEATKANIASAIHGFSVLANTYSDMRDIGFEEVEKEKIDMAYSEVNDLRSNLAALQAGGKRAGRKTRKQKANHSFEGLKR